MATSAELLMGLFFTVAGGSALDVPTVLTGTLTSAWFLWSMAAAMVALLLWVPLRRAVRDPLLGLAAAGVVAPFVPVDPPVGALLMGAVMAVTILEAFQLVRTGRGASIGRVLNLVVGAFLAMNLAGIAIAIDPNSLAPTLAFGTIMAVTMAVEFLFLVREGLARHGNAAPPRALAPVAIGAGTARAPASARP